MTKTNLKSKVFINFAIGYAYDMHNHEVVIF